MSPVLEVQNLVKHYSGVRAVDDISLDLGEGEIHALIGPNGAGKSTAIGMLDGEIQPDSGSITLRGEAIDHLPPWHRATRGIGRTYQVTSVIRELTVLENMVIGLLCQAWEKEIGLGSVLGKTGMNERAGVILEHFGLADRSLLPAGKLSHGEQGRLEIAMCLSTEPSLLLLDEPMSGMSLHDGEQIVSLLLEIKQSAPILLVEHDMNAVFTLADRISVMASGKIIITGTPDEIRSHPEVIEAYLGEAHA